MRGLWRAIPKQRRMRVLHVFNTQFNIRKSEAVPFDDFTRRRLAKFYVDDVAKLTDVAGVTPPWPEFKSANATNSS